MSANINFNKQAKEHSFFSVKQKVWWGEEAKIVDSCYTTKEALELAHLNYNVIKAPLFTTVDSGLSIGSDGLVADQKQIKIKSHVATLRDDTNQQLGVVSKSYQIVQNEEALSFFDNIINTGTGVSFETAGALGNGERIFVTAKLPENIRVGKNDDVEQYLFLTTSHDGTGSITVAYTPVRVVCQNTLNAALRNCTNRINIRHSRSAKEKLSQAHEVMGLAANLSVKTAELFNHWSKVRITDSEVKKLIALAMAPSKEILKQMKDGDEAFTMSTRFKNVVDDVYAFTTGDSTQQMDTTMGTLFGAYNGVTGYFHRYGYNNYEARMKSILLGGNAMKHGQSAFDLCQEYADNGAGILMFN